MGKGSRLKAIKEAKNIDPDAVLLGANPKLVNEVFPEMSNKEKQDLIGTKIRTEDGKNFVMKEITHKDLGGNDSLATVEAVRVPTALTMHLGENSELDMDWDEQKYLDNMYDQFLDAVQFSDLFVTDKLKGTYEGKIYSEASTFEEYCKDSLASLTDQRNLFKAKLVGQKITARQHGNAVEILERCEATLSRLIEGSIKYE